MIARNVCLRVRIHHKDIALIGIQSLPTAAAFLHAKLFGHSHSTGNISFLTTFSGMGSRVDRVHGELQRRHHQDGRYRLEGHGFEV